MMDARRWRGHLSNDRSSGLTENHRVALSTASPARLPRDRKAAGLSAAALVMVAAVWSLLAYRTAQGRGPGSGDVAAGLAGLGELVHLLVTAVGGVIATVLAYPARRRLPDSLLVIVALSLSIATVVASAVLVALLLFS